ncbi:MAG: hypothetical protein GX776_07275, partial [Oxalobacter sp.]|nr:hypothetical protein [Oxalobacter sp.]
MDDKDFKQAMKWYRRAPVTHVAPDSGSLVSPQKKDVTQREKARVWFPRPAACSMGVKPGSQSEDETKQDSAYGALAVYREKHVRVHGPAEKVDQPESMNAPEVPLADTMTEDNPPHDVDYTVVSDEDEPLQLGMSADGAA